jgi:transposase
MSARFVNVDRETAMLFPVDIKEWLPENHLVHFIVEAVEMLDIQKFKVNERRSGDEQYPPEMMLSLLIYGYVTGRMSSRVIEDATYTDVAVRYICGNTAHPDHSVICRFRTSNREAFQEAFTKVLVMAQGMGHLKKVGGISVDGTKIHANANKHSAVSYKRATEMIAEIEKEVCELIAKAEEADSKPLEAGLSIPEEIRRREDRKAKLEEAKKEMEARYQEAAQEKGRAEEDAEKPDEDKTEENDAEAPVKGNGNGSAKASDEKQTKAAKAGKALDEYQYNFTDPESRIMKAGSGKHFEQSYNAEAAVDIESMLIVGGYVTNHANDKKELEAAVNSVDEVYEVETVSADTGFYSEEAVHAVEQRDEKGKCQGAEVYCAVEKQSHHRSVQDLEKKEAEKAPAENASAKEIMAHRLRTKKGRAIYKKRKETVEPVFGIIKQAMGFRQFLLRGLERTAIEWDLVTLSYNFKRLFSLSGRKKPSFSWMMT